MIITQLPECFKKNIECDRNRFSDMLLIYPKISIIIQVTLIDWEAIIMTMYDKIAQMKPEQKNHWIDIPELSYWGERFFAEFSVAEVLAQPEERSVLEQSIDHLYGSYIKEHALTDTACQEAEQYLLPFSERAKAFNLHCVGHAHIDMDWMWGLHETVDTTMSTFRTMLDMMDEYEDFTFSQSQCAVYKMTEFYDPALYRRMKKRIEEGRFEFAGSSWVELDKNMPDLESMARHILYTKRYLHEKFGIAFEDIQLDFHPDTFGHSADIPAILNAGGIKYFYHCRGLDGTYLYRWQGPSGSEVLALNEPLWYNDRVLPMYLHQVPKFCTEHGIRDMMKIYGVGDHGGGPTRQDIERIIDMQSWPVAPTIFFSTYKRYFEAIAPHKDNFPTLTGELGPTFTGCYSSQSKIKLANRIGEDRLFIGEALAAFAVKETGMDDYNDQFRVAWERILFNQFHDILPGSNTPESRDHAMGAFEEALGCVMAASGASLRAFADNIDTSCFETPFEPMVSRSEGGGMGLDVDQKHRFRMPSTERGVGKTRLLHFFNTTGFDREQVLEATLWDWPGDHERIRATDVNGQELPVSAVTMNGVDWGHNRTDLLVRATVPAMGYTTIKIDEAPKKRFTFCELPPDPRILYYPSLVLENDLVRIEFREDDLSVKRYLNKETGKELLGPEGGRFILYRERTVPKGGCGWVEGVHMDPRDLHTAGKPILKSPVNKGLLRQSFSYDILYGESVLHVTARLDEGSPVLELDVTARWLEKADDLGTPTLSFRLALTDAPETFLSDSQIGVQVRTPEPMHDRCSRNFFHAVLPDSGATLLTDSKYGYRGYENKLEVTLLRSSSRPDPFPEIGDRSFRIGMTDASHGTTALKKLGQTFSLRDLPFASNRAHKGILPLEKQILNVSGAVISALKVAEDKSGLILRAEAMEDGIMTLRADGLREAYSVDLAEQIVSQMSLQDDGVAIPVTTGDIISLKLIF